MQAHKSKTKIRRSVEMSDNCFVCLKLTEFSLPIPSATHHWDNFLSDAKKLLGYDKWPHDCLRHSYCSYALRKYESAGKVAMFAGHSEGTLQALPQGGYEGRGRGILEDISRGDAESGSIVKTAKKRGPQMRYVGFLFCPGGS